MRTTTPPGPGLVALARAGDDDAFHALTEPHRHELEVHCYRLLGSIGDAEDLVQETLLAAWRGLRSFEARSSVRTWLYRIATNLCLNARRDASRRPGRAIAAPAGAPAPTRLGEPSWLQPWPEDRMDGLLDPAPGPGARYEAREALALAFVAGLQRLPPAQRATLVLRDVLGFRAAEVADMLGGTEAAVNSGLRRARATLEARLPEAGRERAPAPRSARERAVAARFADAFERGDVDAIVAVLTDDAWLTMPPAPLGYQGPAAIGRFFATVPAGGELERFRFVPTRANGQPAFGVYLAERDGAVASGTGVLVLALEGDLIAALTVFHDTTLLPRFGLPETVLR